MTKKIKKLAWEFLILGIIILTYLILKSMIDGFGISMKNNTNYEVTGQFGDFVGGVIGTFLALAGTLTMHIDHLLDINNLEYHKEHIFINDLNSL